MNTITQLAQTMSAQGPEAEGGTPQEAPIEVPMEKSETTPPEEGGESGGQPTPQENAPEAPDFTDVFERFGAKDKDELVQKWEEHLESSGQLQEKIQELESNKFEFYDPTMKSLHDWVVKAAPNSEDLPQLIKQYVDIQLTDFRKLEPLELVRKHMGAISPMLTNEDVDYLIKDKYEFVPDEDMDEDQIKRLQGLKNAQLRQDASTALNYFERLKSETAVPQRHRDLEAQREQDEALAKSFKQSISKTVNNFALELKGVFPKGIDDFKYKPSSDLSKKIISNLRNAEGLHRSSPEDVQSVINFMVLNDPDGQKEFFSALGSHFQSRITKAQNNELSNVPPTIGGAPPQAQEQSSNDHQKILDAMLGT